MTLHSRTDRAGNVLHYGPANTFTIGRKDQCEYEGCSGYKASMSRHCIMHSR